MEEYYKSVMEVDDNKLPNRVKVKLLRTKTPHQFYRCLEAAGYMPDVFDFKRRYKYPWTE